MHRTFDAQLLRCTAPPMHKLRGYTFVDAPTAHPATVYAARVTR
jgi:hypothetical protein